MPQAAAQTKLTAPITTNDPRQLTSRISQATSGGVRALPSLANACVIPCANPRFSAGVQLDIARVATGSADTPPPSSTRPRIMPDRLWARPMSTVADDQMMAKTVSARRAPNLSATQPPAIWKARYGYPNAEKIKP